MRLAEAAVAAPGDASPVTRSQQTGKQRCLVLCQDLCARRDLDHHVLAGRACPVLAHAAATVLSLEMLTVAVLDQRVEVGDAFHPHVPALAAIPAIWPPELVDLLPPQRIGASPAIA